MIKMAITLAAVAGILLMNLPAMAAPSAVLIKFTDKTRFDKIGSAEILSDLIALKLFDSGKFRLKEARAIDIETERELYDKKSAEKNNIATAMQTGNLDVMFSGEGFNSNKVSSIDAAVTGQIVHPKLTRAIGAKNGVDYLIQGTVEQFGITREVDSSFGTVAMIASLAGMPGVGILSGAQTEKNFLGVAVSMRIIEANTGKVVWDKKIVGHSHVTSLSNDKIFIGTAKLHGETFHKALSEAAENIVDAMIEDSSWQKFF